MYVDTYLWAKFLSHVAVVVQVVVVVVCVQNWSFLYRTQSNKLSLSLSLLHQTYTKFNCNFVFICSTYTQAVIKTILFHLRNDFIEKQRNSFPPFFLFSSLPLHSFRVWWIIRTMCVCVQSSKKRLVSRFIADWLMLVGWSDWLVSWSNSTLSFFFDTNIYIYIDKKSEREREREREREKESGRHSRSNRDRHKLDRDGMIRFE